MGTGNYGFHVQIDWDSLLTLLILSVFLPGHGHLQKVSLCIRRHGCLPVPESGSFRKLLSSLPTAPAGSALRAGDGTPAPEPLPLPVTQCSCGSQGSFPSEAAFSSTARNTWPGHRRAVRAITSTFTTIPMQNKDPWHLLLLAGISIQE